VVEFCHLDIDIQMSVRMPHATQALAPLAPEI
jgi:hypothetical protein